MSPLIVSLMMSAGVATFIYTKAGSRLGYGNAKNVYIVTGVTFILVFLVCIILLTQIIHL